MKIHFLTFATTSWTHATERMVRDTKKMHDELGLMESASVLNETDLGSDWNERFEKFKKDRGYAYWSWKPYIILRRLREIPDDEFLLYMDAGRSLPGDEEGMRGLCAMLSEKAERMSSDSILFLSISHGRIPVRRVIRRQILELFGLESDADFGNKSPHYNAGVIFIRNSRSARDFVEKWFNTMRDHYEDAIRSDYADKTGQDPDFLHNVGDQAVLHCLIRKEGISPLCMNDLVGRFNLYTRKRG